MYKLEFALPKFAMYKRMLAKVLAERFVIDRGWSEEKAIALGRQVLRDNVDWCSARSRSGSFLGCALLGDVSAPGETFNTPVFLAPLAIFLEFAACAKYDERSVVSQPTCSCRPLPAGF